MKTQMSMFGIALLIMILIVAIILGFAAGPTSPLTWALVAFLIAIPYLHIILGFAAGPTSPLTWALVAFLIAIPYLHRRYAMQNYVEWPPICHAELCGVE